MGARLLCSLALVLGLLFSLAPSTHWAAAQSGGNGLDGNAYSDPDFGFSFEWDAGEYETEEIVDADDGPYGVYFTSETVSASISAAGYTDPETCVEERVALLEEVVGVTDVTESREIDPPVFKRDTVVVVVQYNYANPDDDANAGEFVNYYGCEQLLIDGEPTDGVMLTHDYGVQSDLFESTIGDWVALIDSVQFEGDESGTTDPTPEIDSPDGIYVDPAFAFSVSWDPDQYESTLLLDENDAPYGVDLNADRSRGSIAATSATTLRRCVNDAADRYEGLDGISDFEEVDDLDLPETDPDARAAIYRMTYDGGDGPEGYFQYFECREILVEGEAVEDIALVTEFGAFENEYETILPDWENIIASITFDVEASSSDPATPTTSTDEAGVAGDTYVDPVNGWSMSWDDAVLTGSNWPGESEDILGLQLVSEAGSFLTVITHEATTIRRCLSDQIDELEGGAFSDFEEVDTVDLPESSTESRVALYEAVFTSSSGSESEIYFYADCQPLLFDGEEVEDMFVAVNGISDVATYEDELPAWSDVLTSISFGSGGTSSGDPDPEPTGDAPLDGGLTSDSYTSAIGYSLTWDDAVFTAELRDEDNPDAGVVLSSSNSFITIQAAADPTLADCVAAEVSVVEGSEGMGSLSRARGADSPESAADGESDFLQGTLTLTDGSDFDIYAYLECRPMGFEIQGNEMAVVIRVISVQSGFDDELPVLQEMLDSIALLEE